MHHLHIAAACLFNTQGHLLTVRKRGTQAWMLPGGKRDGDETPLQALVRELQEELPITMAAADFAPLGQFSAIAANEAATQVHAHVLVAHAPCSRPCRPRPRLRVCSGWHWTSRCRTPWRRCCAAR